MHFCLLRLVCELLGKSDTEVFYLSEESHVPLYFVSVTLLDLRVKHLDDVIQHLTSDMILTIAGTLAA